MFVIRTNSSYFSAVYNSRENAVKEMAELFEMSFCKGYFDGIETIEELEKHMSFYGYYVEDWEIRG